MVKSEDTVKAEFVGDELKEETTTELPNDHDKDKDEHVGFTDGKLL